MTRESREEQKRPTRQSVSSQRDKLSVSGLDTSSFYYRWVNDLDERLQTFLAAGYEFVTKAEVKKAGDTTVDTSLGTDSRIRKGVGQGVVAYLMKLPLAFRKEYEAEKEADILETERAMRQLKTKTGHLASQEADYGSFDISVKDRK